MNRPLVIILAAHAVAAAAAPVPREFAHGLTVSAPGAAPVQEIVVNEKVYAGITRPDLADLRIFNGAGVVVPHALCAPESQTLAQPYEQALELVPVTNAPAASAPGGTRVEVETSGTVRLEVQPSGNAAPESGAAAPIGAYVVDLGAVRRGDALRVLRLDWVAENGASEAAVRVLSGADLERWSVLVPRAVLFRAQGASQQLERLRIALPRNPADDGHRYLRIEPADASATVRLTTAVGEFVHQPPLPDPAAFAAQPLPQPPAEPASFLFDAGHLAPVVAATVQLPAANLALRVALDSRASAAAPWQPRWSGEIYELESGDSTVKAPAIRFGATADRYWRVRVLRGLESLAGRPALELAYRPHRIRFLKQGASPFLLAYGSARTPPAPPVRCEEFLAGLGPEQMERLIARTSQTAAAPVAAVGGAEALQPLPPPRPVRQIVLWSVLAVGAIAVALMALGLLRRIGRGPKP